MNSSFSIIVPTCGRDSLQKVIETTTLQMGHYDQLIIVGDGEQPNARKIVQHFVMETPAGRGYIGYFETPKQTKNYGNDQRDLGMSIATGDRLLFMDDDDEFTPDALDTVRSYDTMYPGKVLIFQMYQEQTQRTLWEQPDFRAGNIGTPMFSPVNDKANLAKWGPTGHYGSDFDFMARTIEKQGEPVFVEKVIAIIHHVP